MLMEIVTHTPLWVPAVFVGLLALGYSQTADRAATRARVTTLPIIFTLLSIGGVLSSFGPDIAGILAWIGGLLVAVGYNRLVPAPVGVRYDPASRRFHLPGSWVPLALMMLIFAAKYVVGATTALNPAAVHTLPFVVVLSCVFGLGSGTFIARFLRIHAAMATPMAAAVHADQAPNAILEPQT